MDSFDQFWAAFPRREKKQSARDAFAWAMKKHNGDGQLLARILGTIGWQLVVQPEPRYWQQADKWILGMRWEDERPMSAAEKAAEAELARRRAEFEKWKAQGHPQFTPYATFEEFAQRRRA